MKQLVTLALLAAALAAPSAAGAKGVVDVEICGATKCVSVHATGEGQPGDALGYGLLQVGGSFNLVAAPPAGPWYSVEIEADWFGRNRMLPYSDGLLGTGNSWIRPDLPVATWLKRLTRDLEPRPAPVIHGATVDGRPVNAPAPYQALLGKLPIADPPGRLGDSTVIRLTPDIVTQWADPDRPLAYFPPQQLLRRGPDWVRVPDDLAAVIAADAGLAPATASASASGFPAGDVAAALAALAAAGVVLVLVSRRRRRSRAT